MHARNKFKDRPPPPTREEIEHTTRLQNMILGFRHRCTLPLCKRKRRCSGDPEACFNRWWPLTHEKLKFEFRVFIKAMSAGRTFHEAMSDAEMESARWADHIDRVEAQRVAALEAKEQAARQAAMPSQRPEPAPPCASPRVRVL